MQKPHEPPKSHTHLCFLSCSKPYKCSNPECRSLKWFGVCPRCQLKADNEFQEYRAYTHVRINDPLERQLQKDHKLYFNPKPKQPTLHVLPDEEE